MRFWQPTLVVALLAASVAVAGSHAGTPRPAFVVETLSNWVGKSKIFEIGYPDTATYGQTITVPDGYPVLKSFSFLFLVPKNNSFRGELYAWDGDSATGSKIWSSGRKHTRGSQPTVETFHPGATLIPGDQ